VIAKVPGRTALLVGLMIVLQFFVGPEVLRYERLAMLQEQQWWRLISAHWVHVNSIHLLLNLVGFVIISSLVRLQQWSYGYYFGSLLGMDLFISLMLLWQHPQIGWYVGISAVLYGLLLQGAILLWPREKFWAVLLSCLCIGKIILEQLEGGSVTTEQWIGTAVLVDAHFYGAIAGFSIAVVTQMHRIRARLQLPTGGPQTKSPTPVSETERRGNE